MLPQMIGYVKCFDSNKTMSFKVGMKSCLKSILKYGKKTSSLDGKIFDGELVYGNSDKYTETKIKSCGDNANIR